MTMMSHISILACLLLIACAGRLEAFSSHETIKSAKKYFEVFDELLGPVFDDKGAFAYAKVKYFNKKPPAIRVTLEIFQKKSSKFSTSTKKFVTDTGCRNISAALLNLNPTLFAISEKQENGDNKTELVEWDPLSYPDSSLNLPMDYILTKGHESDSQLFLNDKSTCGTSNGKCIVEFGKSHKPRKSEFYHGDLVWPGMQIDYIDFHTLIYLIRGFDAAGHFKFLQCDTASWSSGCTELLSLPKASSSVESYPIFRGICLMENPGKSVNCVKFYMNTRRGNKVAMNMTVTYEEPTTLLQVADTGRSVVLLVARKAQCLADECFNIIIDKISSEDVTDTVTRYTVKLECSDDDTLLKVNASKNKEMNTLVVEYVCEVADGFTFKSVTIKDK